MQSVVERGEGQRLQLEYNPDLFEAATIERFLRDYVALLEAIAATPDLPLEALKLESAPRAKPASGERPAPAVLPTLVAPRDEAEKKLVTIWEEALGTSPIGIEDNYFELGGHSLVAVRIMTQIHKQLGKELPLASLVEAPTIAELAERLRDKTWSASWSSLVPIQGERHGLRSTVMPRAGTCHVSRPRATSGTPSRLRAAGANLDGDGRRTSPQAMGRDVRRSTSSSRRARITSADLLRRDDRVRDNPAARPPGQGRCRPRALRHVGARLPALHPGMRRRLKLAKLVERVDLHVGNLVAADGAARTHTSRRSQSRQNSAIKHTKKRLGRLREFTNTSSSRSALLKIEARRGVATNATSLSRTRGA